MGALDYNDVLRPFNDSKLDAVRKMRPAFTTCRPFSPGEIATSISTTSDWRAAMKLKENRLLTVDHESCQGAVDLGIYEDVSSAYKDYRGKLTRDCQRTELQIHALQKGSQVSEVRAGYRCSVGEEGFVYLRAVKRPHVLSYHREKPTASVRQLMGGHSPWPNSSGFGSRSRKFASTLLIHSAQKKHKNTQYRLDEHDRVFHLLGVPQYVVARFLDALRHYFVDRLQGLWAAGEQRVEQFRVIPLVVEEHVPTAAGRH